MKPGSTPPPAADTARLGRIMTYLAWAIALALLTWFFSEWLARERNPNRSVQTRIDGAGQAEVTLKRNRYGHYITSGRINGEPVEFLVDTGASDVSIPGALGKRLRLKAGPAYSATTANGVVTVYATRLESVEVGNISLYNVSASINPQYDQDNEVLLGMSFLKDLELIQRGDTLILRQIH